MSGAFPISGQMPWLIPFVILPLSSFCSASNGSQVPKAFNWCSSKHCEDCSDEVVCTNGAVSRRYGDLCGCCHTCVQTRDLGASCGSQLAVRTSFANFEDSRSRVTVLATTKCKAGLVCTNFICESSNDRIDRISAAPVERDVENIQQKLKIQNDVNDSKKSDDFVTKLKNEKKSEIFYNPHHSYDAEEIYHRTINWTPWPIRLTSNIKLHIDTDKNEVPSMRRDVKQSNIEFDTHQSSHEIKNDPKNIPYFEGHLINVIIGDKEFQLIYGKTALIDLQILLNSFNIQSTSILDEFEARLLYERFQNVIEKLNSTKESSILKKVENETKSLINTVQDSENFLFQHQFLIPRSSKLIRFLQPTRRFRGKRELENTEEKNPRSEYSEIVVYDFFNKTPKLMQNSSHNFLFARQVDTNFEEKLLTSQNLDPEDMEQAINIHITGIPKSVKSSEDFNLIDEAETRERRTVTGTEDYENYDDELEIFVKDSSTDVPEFSRTDDDQRNSSNFTISPMSQEFSDLDNESYDVNNISEKYWDTSIIGDKNSRYSDNNYEFTFPENPVILENDDYHDLTIRINETVNEFKAQLDRIETKVVVIESSLYEMIMKFEANERFKNGGNKKRARDFIYPNLRKNLSAIRRNAAMYNPKIIKPEESNQFIGRYVLLPKQKANYHSNENSTSTYLSLLPINKNGRNFNIEDEGIAQFIPIRSNRQWRTITLQPNSVETQNILRARGRHYSNQNERNRVNDESQRRRRKTMQRSLSSEQRNAVRFNARRVSKEDPIYSTEETQPPIFLSNPATKSYILTKAPNLFSRERYSLKFTAEPSRPNRPLTAERSKRRSEEANRRSGSNLEIAETPSIEESVSILETQIPKSVVRTRMSKDFDKRMAESSSRIEATMIPIAASMRHSFNDEDDWNRNSWDEVPSLNLFVVNGESKSEFGGEAFSNARESYDTPVLSIENENSKSENNWDIAYPAYLDYSERLRRDEQLDNDETPIVEAEATESSINPRRSRQIGMESVERKKRNVVDDLQSENTDKTILSSWNNISTNIEDKNKKKITKRSVQMVDWLRAAQEYHERLHQVRNAALRTWLASREELADGNLTNVKLFTREIPSYLEKYTPSFINEDDSALKSEASHDDPQISTIDNDESFAEFFPNQSSALDNENKLKNSSNETNSIVARKFTIITTGNSTIRIEELPEMNKYNNDSSFVDQLSEGSNDNEFAVAHRIALTSDDSDDFDHMYESVDAEDEDFDYGDPNFALSRWLDEVDIIDASSVETTNDKTKSIDDNNEDSSNVEEDYEVDELLRRTKRNTPLLLFKVKGNPSQDVVVWPSNWKDFINRHFQRNRTRNSPISSTRTLKKTRRISKIGSAKTPNLNAKVQTSFDRDAKIFSSETANPEEEKDSSREFDYARRQYFDDGPRLGRRKNNQRNI